MNVELQALRRVAGDLARCWAAGSFFALATVCVSALLPSATSVLAQEVAAPPKIKTVKPKTAAKAKEVSGGEAGDEKTAAVPVKRDPAQAGRTLESGIKLLQAGKTEQAIQSFNTIISGGQVPPQIMARALHQRGAAYRAAGKPAQAVSDLTSALWLKGGLTEPERADAAQQRTAAYREAGLPDQSDPADLKTAPAAKRLATSPQSIGSVPSGSVPPVTTASLAPASAQQPATQPTAPAVSPLGTFFGNLFGSGSSNGSAAVAQPAPAPALQQPATSGWSSATTPATAKAPTVARAAAMVVPPAPPPPATSVAPAKVVVTGGVHARIITRSEAEANALAGRLKSEFGGQLDGRTPAVTQAQFGGMGSFFQVRVGPYKTSGEAQQFCGRIKATGADCVAVTQ